MKEKFFIKIESIHAQDNGSQENVTKYLFFFNNFDYSANFMKFVIIILNKKKPFKLPPDVLKKREVIYIDIANDTVSAGVRLCSFGIIFFG